MDASSKGKEGEEGKEKKEKLYMVSWNREPVPVTSVLISEINIWLPLFEYKSMALYLLNVCDLYIPFRMRRYITGIEG